MANGIKDQKLTFAAILMVTFWLSPFLLAEIHTEAVLKLQPEKEASEEPDAEDRVLAEFDAGMPTEKYFRLTRPEKIKAIEKLMRMYKKEEGISITKSAEDYVNMIDYLVGSDPTLVDMPIGDLFKTLCQLEGDFKEE